MCRAQVPFQLYSVSFADSSHGWAVGADNTTGGVIPSSSDRGTHWTLQSTGTNEPEAVAFADVNHGWAVGDSGVTIPATRP